MGIFRLGRATKQNFGSQKISEISQTISKISQDVWIQRPHIISFDVRFWISKFMPDLKISNKLIEILKYCKSSFYQWFGSRCKFELCERFDNIKHNLVLESHLPNLCRSPGKMNIVTRGILISHIVVNHNQKLTSKKPSWGEVDVVVNQGESQEERI